jgi:hypothetical protein
MSIYHNYQAVAESGLGIENFFCITVTDYDVTLLAWNEPKVLEICKNVGYKFVWDDQNNRLVSNNNEVIKIVLVYKH